MLDWVGFRPSGSARQGNGHTRSQMLQRTVYFKYCCAYGWWLYGMVPPCCRRAELVTFVMRHVNQMTSWRCCIATLYRLSGHSDLFTNR